MAKRRLVKLVVNFLFYFRTDEDEVGTLGSPEGGRAARAGGRAGGRRSRPCLAQPLGALLLERCRVTQEEPGGFSISEWTPASRTDHPLRGTGAP